MTLYQLLKNIQYNRALLWEITLRFDPLLRKYARLLNDSDAYADLRLAFCELVVNMDVDTIKNPSEGAIVNYIRKSIYHSYLRLSRKNRRYTYHHLLSDDYATEQEILKNYGMVAYDTYTTIDDKWLMQCLTKIEYEIITLYYIYGYTIHEIAEHKQVSRQSINQRKLHALKKLKSAYLSDTPD